MKNIAEAIAAMTQTLFSRTVPLM